MIIFKDKTGQLANNLFEFSTFIALGMDNKRWIFNTTFYSYLGFFRGSRFPVNFKFRTLTFFDNEKVNRFILKAFLKVIGVYTKTESLQGEGTPIQVSKIPKGFVIKTGGWFTAFENFYAHQDTIRAYFRPVRKFEMQVEKYMSTHKKPAKILIGVHIRKGDYKEFMDGQFYYENDIYCQKMKDLIALFPEKEVQFMIASNEPIESSDFEGIDFFKAPNHFLLDLYSLAQCDYLIGPPSTYTMWASFYGRKPLQKIHSREQKMSRAAFEMDYGY